jgi:hypothetical protein
MTLEMSSSAKVAIHPLGLTGFALFLVFSFLGKNRQRKKPTWLTPVAFAMAVAALAGGLFLSYQETNRTPAASSPPRIDQIKQSAGASSSNVAAVQGNVSVVIGGTNAKDHSGRGPLTEDDISSILESGEKSETIVDQIQRRGIGFRMTPELAKKFRLAGASKAVLDALNKD